MPFPIHNFDKLQGTQEFLQNYHEMGSVKRILIVDDHKIFREGLSFLISQMDGYIIAGEASDGASFLKMLEKAEADIVLMDIAMPGMNGILASNAALSLYPALKIIILTMSCDVASYYELVRTGVAGFILKESGREELQKALDSVSRGNVYYSQKLLQKMIASQDQKTMPVEKPVSCDISFTETENQVLRMICEGLSINSISEKLSISIRMVESLKTRLLTKTGSKNPVSLAVFALKNNLVDF